MKKKEQLVIMKSSIAVEGSMTQTSHKPEGIP